MIAYHDPRRPAETAARRTRNALATLIFIAACGLGMILVACGGGNESTAGSSQIQVGALLDLSGSWQTLGRASQATLETAVLDLNNSLASQGRTERVQLVVEDTGLDPDTVLSKLQSLEARGVRIVIGPQSSAEVSKIKDYADANGIIVISQSSTASSLATVGDNVFRFTPDDRLEAEALVTLMWEDGKRTILPVCRKDAGNLGLCSSVTQKFEERGGTVLTSLQYEATTTEMAGVAAQIQTSLIGQTGPSTAVYLAAFDEAVQLFRQAAPNDVLSGIEWYGSDGMALNTTLIAAPNNDSAQFAVDIGYPNPLPGLDPDKQSQWQPLFDLVKAVVGYDPDAFALSTYDALTIAVKAYLEAGGTTDLALYKQKFVEAANSNNSITGSTELNEAGDRKIGLFDFWAVRSTESGSYEWEKVATYRPSEGGGVIDHLSR